MSANNIIFINNKCKEKMRPVKRALKVLEQPMEDLPQEQQVSQTKEVFIYLLCMCIIKF